MWLNYVLCPRNYVPEIEAVISSWVMIYPRVFVSIYHWQLKRSKSSAQKHSSLILRPRTDASVIVYGKDNTGCQNKNANETTKMIPIKLSKIPYLAIVFTSTTPLDMAIALGGVAIGNIKA